MTAADNERMIEYLSPDGLRPHPRNARLHPKKQLSQIKRSIEKFGFTVPVLIDEVGVILAGHGRVEAAKMLGLESIPCVRVSHLTDAQKRAYLLADNKFALNAGWDEEILATELGEILLLDEIEIEDTGFSIAEVDGLIASNAPEEPNDPRDDALPASAPRRCNLGDIWALGRHRLICGDARNMETVRKLMGGEQARMVFTDPPYNVPIAGHVSGLGKVTHREFAMAAGEMNSEEFTSFLSEIFGNLVMASVDGAIHFICMDWRHLTEMQEAGGRIYTELKNLIIWVKDNGGMGTFYRSRHELIFAFKVGAAPHINTFELGQHGRYRTNVWNYRGVNTLKTNRMEELSLHPTVKPVQMIADAIKDVSGRGEIVLDLFAGSGSTLIAAEKTGRRAYVCELDPLYCDVIIERWEKYSKDEACRIVSGLSVTDSAAG